ncbi:MAG: helix-turn-helix domain-containing protein [Lachnospiraceae bacterium]|nr:helix-turn-helix domain-containing protein [Lachnospiraceae bacterium]
MRKRAQITPKDVQHLLTLKLDSGFAHYSQNEDMKRYEYMIMGDMRSVEEARKTFIAARQGCLSKDPIRNLKYMFAISTGLASRFVVEAGLPIEVAYSISDLYIQKMDELNTESEITELQCEMHAHYTREMQKLRKQNALSRPVNQCIEYIDSHLNEHITLAVLSAQIGLSAGHLSAVFKKEMNQTIGDYITKARIESAKNMLNYSEYTYSQISSALAFSSQSHFTKVFREKTGYTPKEYRMKFYVKSISSLKS